VQDIANKAACKSGISPSACSYTMPMYTLWLAAFVGNLVGAEIHLCFSGMIGTLPFDIRPAYSTQARTVMHGWSRWTCWWCMGFIFAEQNAPIVFSHLGISLMQVMVFAICPFTLFFYEADSEL
jgi:hypothetical protein